MSKKIRVIVVDDSALVRSLLAEIINRQLCHFFRANIELGMRVAQGLGVNIDANTMNHTK